MQLQQIEDRIVELTEVIGSLEENLANARHEQQEAQADMRCTKVLNEIERFIKSVNDEISRNESHDEKVKIAVGGLAKLGEFARTEPLRLRDRAIALSERVAVIEGTISFIGGRRGSYEGKAAAINRVVDGTGDPRHPEKISTVREAERIKKQRKTDT
jgi:chromosome segregation ATPase